MFNGEYRIIVSKRRRRMAFRINDSGVLEILVPEGTPESLAVKVAAEHRDVIEKLYAEFAQQAPGPRYQFKEGELFPLWNKQLQLKFSSRLLMMTESELVVPAGPPEEVQKKVESLYRKAAPQLLWEKCLFFGTAHQLLPASVGVTAATTRWGSCNSRKHISFCWKILLLPEELADYIVCHELAHLKELNHSQNFWQLTEKLCPNALEKRARLRQLPEPWSKLS
ncbi:MAG: M48 family metallopeptidase [Lentisphaerae bacterium]|nr:M48 family metallopeptidase [Lentisphaerota bacterium]